MLLSAMPPRAARKRASGAPAPPVIECGLGQRRRSTHVSAIQLRNRCDRHRYRQVRKIDWRMADEGKQTGQAASAMLSMMPLITGYMPSRVVHIAAQLRLADLLAAGPVSSARAGARDKSSSASPCAYRKPDPSVIIALESLKLAG